MRRGPPEDSGACSPHPRPGVSARASLPQKHTEKVLEKGGPPHSKSSSQRPDWLSYRTRAGPSVRRDEEDSGARPDSAAAAQRSLGFDRSFRRAAAPTHPSPAIAPGFRDAGASSVAVMGQQPRLSGGLVACARPLARPPAV